MADDFLAKYAGRSFAELVKNEEDGNGNDSIESFSEMLMADIAEPSPSEVGDEVEDEGKQEQGEDDCHESSGIYVEAEVKVEISPVEPPRVVPTAAEKIVETKIANQWPEATALRALQAAVSSHSLNDLMQKKRQEVAELQQLQALSVKQEQQAERSSGSSGSAAVPAAGSHDDRPISRLCLQLWPFQSCSCWRSWTASNWRRWTTSNFALNMSFCIYFKNTLLLFVF